MFISFSYLTIFDYFCIIAYSTTSEDFFKSLAEWQFWKMLELWCEYSHGLDEWYTTYIEFVEL
jgi:hypothetical protein